MKYPELLKNDEFLGFLRIWREQYCVPFALEDWLMEKNYPGLSKVIKWAVTIKGRLRYSGGTNGGLYPWGPMPSKYYYWQNMIPLQKASDYLPISDEKIRNLDKLGHSFEEAVLCMLEVMEEQLETS